MSFHKGPLYDCMITVWTYIQVLYFFIHRVELFFEVINNKFTVLCHELCTVLYPLSSVPRWVEIRPTFRKCHKISGRVDLNGTFHDFYALQI